MEYAALNNGVKMPMEGVGTFLFTPDEAEAFCVSALRSGYRLIDTANAYLYPENHALDAWRGTERFARI